MTLPLISGLLETLSGELLQMSGLADASDQNTDGTVVVEDPVAEFRNEFQRMLIPSEEEDTDAPLSAKPEGDGETEKEAPVLKEKPQPLVPVLFLFPQGKPEGITPVHSESLSSPESLSQTDQHDGTLFPRQSTAITKPFLVTAPPTVPLTDRAFAIRLEQSRHSTFSPDIPDQPEVSAEQKVEQKADPAEGLLKTGTSKKESSVSVATTEVEVNHPDLSATEPSTLPSDIKTIGIHSKPQSHPVQISPEKASALPEMVSNPAVQKIESILESGRPNSAQQIGIRIEGSDVSQTGSASHPVDLYLEQRGKSLHVSVHTANASLAGEMKGSLHELSARLHQQGYQAEFWSAAEVVPVQQTAKTDFPESREQSQREQENPSNGQKNQDQQQDREEQQSHPRWLAEFEKRLFAPDKTSKK